jgi:hypothetical protein
MYMYIYIYVYIYIQATLAEIEQEAQRFIIYITPSYVCMCVYVCAYICRPN